MGNRIHVQIKREIEYGDYGFNWQIEELMSLLSDSILPGLRTSIFTMCAGRRISI